MNYLQSQLLPALIFLASQFARDVTLAQLNSFQPFAAGHDCGAHKVGKPNERKWEIRRVSEQRFVMMDEYSQYCLTTVMLGKRLFVKYRGRVAIGLM